MVRGDPKNLSEELKRHLTGTKSPSKKRISYKVLILISAFIFLTILSIFVKEPISKWASKTFFTKESNLSIDFASNDVKDTIIDYGENRIYEILNPFLTGKEQGVKLWLTVSGDTVVHIERIKFTLVPCYWYKPIEKQQYTLISEQTIEIPLDFSFDVNCSWVEELRKERIFDFMANMCIEVDYRTNNKFKEQLKCKNFFISTKLLLKQLNETDLTK